MANIQSEIPVSPTVPELAAALLPRTERDNLDEYLRKAVVHKLALPLSHLKGVGASSESWREMQAASLSMNMLLADELLRFVQVLSAEGIPYRALKGVGFALAYYGSIGYRECRDNDLLVPCEAVDDCLAIAKKLGYNAIRNLSKAQSAYERKTQHAFALRHQSSGLELDLHWKAAQRQYDLPDFTHSVWQRQRSVQYQNSELLTLAPVDALFFVAIANAKDNWRYLRCLLDFKLCFDTLQKEEFESLLSRFESQGTAEILLSPLDYLTTVFGDSDSSPDDHNCNVRARSRIQLSSYIGTTLHEWEEYSLHMRLRSRKRHKLRYTWKRLSTPHETDWEYAIPDRLFFVHFLLKFCATCSRASCALARKLLGLTR